MSAPDFWTRRKAAVAAESLAADAATAAKQTEAAAAEVPARDDDEILAEMGLVAPEKVASVEELRAFLAEAVPARLRTRALRQLWKRNPVLANLDGLVDYGEDYTDAATVVENLQTVYQVGKGMFDRTLEEAVPEANEPVEADDDEPEMVALAPVAEDADGNAGLVIAEPEGRDDLPVQTADAAESAPLPARRMRFRFETTG